MDTIGQPAVYNLLGKIEQLLPVLFDQLVDSPPCIEIHILHPPVVEVGPKFTGYEDENEDEEDEEGNGSEDDVQSPAGGSTRAGTSYKK